MLTTTTARRTALPVTIALVVAGLLVAAGSALADKITLNDGEVVYGKVINSGDPVWVKTEDGETRKIRKADVKVIKKGITAASDKKTQPGASAKTTPRTTKAGTGPARTRSNKPPVTFDVAEARARNATAPLAAVAIWQEFIDTKPAGDALAIAKAEQAKWQKLADGNAEKIKGKWVGGDERKAILEKANKLSTEGFQLMKKNSTLQAIAKLEEANSVYPNSFKSNFLLGYLMILQHKTPEATKYFEQALKVQPDSPEALANLGLIQFDKKQYGKAVQYLHRAAQGRDSQGIAMNLCFVVSMSPRQILTSRQHKPAVEAARLLSAKYGIPMPSNTYTFVGLPPEAEKADDLDPLAGAMSSGTGFLVSDDGFILTNRHVVDQGKTFMVMLSDGTKKSAEVVVMDDDQDLALIKIEPDEGKKMPTVSFAKADGPGDGAECTVMGYPLIDRLGASIKITRGIVSSFNPSSVGADVLVDAKVNPGNSGGPMLDKSGNVMAVVSMKSIATATEDSYGMGISAGKARKFLEENNIKPQIGAEAPVPLSAEQIAAKIKPAAVCILATR